MWKQRQRQQCLKTIKKNEINDTSTDPSGDLKKLIKSHQQHMRYHIGKSYFCFNPFLPVFTVRQRAWISDMNYVQHVA